MKINWKVRFFHKPFLTSLFALVLMLVKEIATLFGFDTTIYNDQLTSILNTILAIFVLLGIIIDPTTEGMTDSNQALLYEKPLEKKEGE